MSDTELYDQDETVDTPEEEGDGDAGKSKKEPLPEGFLTPVGMTHLLAKPEEEGGRGTEVRPQQLYGYIRNNKKFEDIAQQNTDGRWMLDVEAFLEWWDEKEERRAEREAKKAAAAAAESESDDE